MATIYKYPYDINGIMESNVIRNEIHTFIDNGRGFILIAPKQAPFHLKDLFIRTTTGQELIRDQDYQLGWYYEGLSNRENAPDIYLAIILKNYSFVNKQVALDYRTVGAEYVMDELEWKQFSQHYTTNPLDIIWDDTEDRPGYYSTDPNLINLDEAIGYEKIADKLEQLFNNSVTSISRIKKIVDSHIQDRVAPHDINLESLGLDHLVGVRKATTKDLINGTDNIKYVAALEFRNYLKDNYVAKGASITVSLKGPKSIYQGTENQWQITNFDSFAEYHILSDDGTVTLDGDIIKLNARADANPTLSKLTIYKDGVQRDVPINIMLRKVNKPTLYYNNHLTSLYIAVNTSTYSTIPANVGAIKDVIYQVSTRSDFANIYEQVISPNEKTWSYINLPNNTVVYLRCKHRSSTLADSDWSEVVSFKSADIAAGMVVAPSTFRNAVGTSKDNLVQNANGLKDYVLDFTAINIIDGKYIPANPSAINPNEIIAVGTEFRCYDANGNLVASSGYKNINWANEGSVDRTITRPDGTTFTFRDRPSTQWCPFQYGLNNVKDVDAPYGVNRPDIGVGLLRFDENLLSNYAKVSGQEFRVESRYLLSNNSWSPWSATTPIRVHNFIASKAYLTGVAFDAVKVATNNLQVGALFNLDGGGITNANAKGDVFERIEVQASLDEQFSSLLIDTQFTLEAPFSVKLPRDTLVYMRFRHVGKYLGTGPWVGSLDRRELQYVRFTTNNVVAPTLYLPTDVYDFTAKQAYSNTQLAGKFTPDGKQYYAANFAVRPNIDTIYLMSQQPPWAHSIEYELRSMDDTVIAKSGSKGIYYANYQMYRGNYDSQYWEGATWCPFGDIDWVSQNYNPRQVGPYGNPAGKMELTRDAAKIHLYGKRVKVVARIQLTDNEWSDWSEPLFVDVPAINLNQHETSWSHTKYEYYTEFRYTFVPRDAGTTIWSVDPINWPSDIGGEGYLDTSGNLVDYSGNPTSPEEYIFYNKRLTERYYTEFNETWQVWTNYSVKSIFVAGQNGWYTRFAYDKKRVPVFDSDGKTSWYMRQGNMIGYTYYSGTTQWYEYIY